MALKDKILGDIQCSDVPNLNKGIHRCPVLMLISLVEGILGTGSGELGTGPGYSPYTFSVCTSISNLVK